MSHVAATAMCADTSRVAGNGCLDREPPWYLCRQGAGGREKHLVGDSRGTAGDGAQSQSISFFFGKNHALVAGQRSTGSIRLLRHTIHLDGIRFHYINLHVSQDAFNPLLPVRVVVF
jgi:hypothetical protein